MQKDLHGLHAVSVRFDFVARVTVDEPVVCPHVRAFER